MKSQLEEMRRKINELLAKSGFSTGATTGAHINPSKPDSIQVTSQRDDIQINWTIISLLSGQRWRIIMSDDDRPRGPQPSKDKEEMLEFIDIELQDLVKCCG